MISMMNISTSDNSIINEEIIKIIRENLLNQSESKIIDTSGENWHLQ